MSRTTRKLKKIYKKAPVFDPSLKYVFLSDTHKGDGEKGSDDFSRNASLFCEILKYYYTRGYMLVLVGDIEELWECKFLDVYKKYKSVYDIEKRFHNDGRLIKIVGNHDFPWYDKKNVKKHLDPIFPGIKVYEGIRIGRVLTKRYNAPQFFVCHGHQGEFASDTVLKVSKFFVKFFWKPFQWMFRISATSAAKNYKKRSKREKEYCKWGKQNKVSLIVGHTHRPRIFTIWHNHVLDGFYSNGHSFIINDGCASFPNLRVSAVELNLNRNMLDIVLFHYDKTATLVKEFVEK